MNNQTRQEQHAIRQLKRLAKDWPESLWSGSLCVIRTDDLANRVYQSGASLGDCIIAQIKGIPNDGGDPH